MSAIDQYRSIDGFILMAATNRLEGLEEALIREGRFDVKIRLDLRDEATRASILAAQLSKKPWRRFDVREIASQTPGAGAARLRALVDQVFLVGKTNHPEDVDTRVLRGGRFSHSNYRFATDFTNPLFANPR